MLIIVIKVVWKDSVTARADNCKGNLGIIDRAKWSWYLDSSLTNNKIVPSISDINGYIYNRGYENIKCKSGGDYIIGAMNESPRCTHHRINKDHMIEVSLSQSEWLRNQYRAERSKMYSDGSAQSVKGQTERQKQKTAKYIVFQHHKVLEGENIAVIAAKYGVSVELLKAVNGLKKDDLMESDVLRIPVELDQSR
jgi:LysM repeat protein